MTASEQAQMMERLEGWIVKHSYKQLWDQATDPEDIQQICREALHVEMQKIDLSRTSEPVAWLTQQVKRRLIDRLRKAGTYARASKDENGEVIYSYRVANRDATSLNKPVWWDEDGDTILQDTLPAREENILPFEDRHALREALQVLTKREREVIACLFVCRLTEREAAIEMGLSQERVNKLKEHALRKLRVAMPQKEEETMETTSPSRRQVYEGEHGLTEREYETLVGAAEGQSSGETAKSLGISTHTVKGHRKKIIAALDAKNMPNAIWIAAERGILKAA